MTALKATAKEAAKDIRTMLKKTFPNQKFSVKTESYAGGASVWVKWVDGPIWEQVKKALNPYQNERYFVNHERSLSKERQSKIADYLKENYKGWDEVAEDYKPVIIREHADVKIPAVKRLTDQEFYNHLSKILHRIAPNGMGSPAITEACKNRMLAKLREIMPEVK